MVTGVFSIPLAPASRPIGRDAVRAGEPSARLAEFIAGSENQLAGVAVEAVLRGTADYNPLLFVGGAGAGKSHLVRGVLARWPRAAEDGAPSRVIATQSAAFCRELARLRASRRLEQWRQRLRSAELLVFEDVQQLAGHAAAQRELIGTIDELLAEGGRLVATSRLLPSAMPDLLPTLASRLISGLVVTLSPPECPARTVLLQTHAAARGAMLESAAAAILASGLAVSAGELLAAVDELVGRCEGAPAVITAELARAWLVARRRGGGVKMGVVAGQVARRYRLKIADLKGPSRRRSVASARALTMYLCRQLSGGSLQQIGTYLGGRDHSTVLHGCQKTEQLLSTDPATRAAVGELKSQLEGSCRL